MNEMETMALEWNFPSTRYVGSKRRLLPQLWEVFSALEFESALDLFSGTASVSYLFKRMGKRVIANDYLWSNYWTAVGLVENDTVTLSQADIGTVLGGTNSSPASKFVAAMFPGLYFTDAENVWLDSCRQGIDELGHVYPEEVGRLKRALAFHALFQSALRKRPFNMFHRRNLYLRLADVSREFGNATTWERSFGEHFREMVTEVNALIFSNGLVHEVHRRDALGSDTLPQSDLVYLDPPYVWRGASSSEVDYLPKYHFLEGLARYQEWPDLIDKNSPILQIRDGYQTWPGGSVAQRRKLLNIYETLVQRYRDRTIVVSYREPGLPSIEEITSILRRFKMRVYKASWPYRYALRKPQPSTAQPTEVVLIGLNGIYKGPGDQVG